jgi:hypothetical protein
MGAAGVVTGAATAASEEKWQQERAGEEGQLAALFAKSTSSSTACMARGTLHAAKKVRTFLAAWVGGQ